MFIERLLVYLLPNVDKTALENYITLAKNSENLYANT